MAAAKPQPVPDSSSMRNHLLRESVEMIRFAFSKGKSVPTSVINVVEQYQEHPAGEPPLECGPLSQAHSRLAKLVEPATPAGIVLLVDEKARGRRLDFMGTVPLVRRLMGTALVCVLAFMSLSLFRLVGDNTITIGNSSGGILLANELFWLAAAGIGASFAILFQVNEYIVKCNYDPKYEPSYWIKFLLGVMAGFILVTLVPIPEEAGGTAAGGHIAKSTLAMLGGYSASAVYRILNRLVEALESLFRGNAKELIAEREEAAAARASEEATGARMRVAAKLVAVQQELAAGAAPEDVTARIREIVASLTPEANEPEFVRTPPPLAPPAPRVTVDAPPEVIVAAGRGPALATVAAAVATASTEDPVGEADPEDDSVG